MPQLAAPYVKSLVFCLRAALALALGAGASAQLVRVPNTTLKFPAAIPPATGYTLENALGDLTFYGPVGIASPPGVTDRLFVVEQDRGIQLVNLETNTKSTFLDLPAVLDAQPGPPTALQLGGECGLLGLAFHPKYNENGFFFIFHSVRILNGDGATGELHQRLARMQAAGTPGSYDAATAVLPGSYTPLITQRDEEGNHNGGDLQFGPDGYLYVSLGDEGGWGDIHDNSRHIAKDFFGGILRIDVDCKPTNRIPNAHTQDESETHPSAVHPGTYRVPTDNPFVNLPGQSGGSVEYGGFYFPSTAVRTEFWAIGLRNPWRMSFDPPTGRLFVADVGEFAREEINLLTSGGFNGGWSWREGSLDFTPVSPPATPPPGLALGEPIYEYGHGTSPFADYTGNSVTGGLVYRGSRLTELTGKYLFGDYISGQIWALTESGTGTWTPQKLLTTPLGWAVSFGSDPRNEDVLVVGYGMVRRLVRSFAGTPPPATLSATGAFTNLATLTPAPGIVGYDVNLPFWSDHAVKTRFFSIPSTTSRMTFAPEGSWTFPNGQVWIKHFEIELTRGDPATRKRLETRFLVKTTEGCYGLTYRWRKSGTEADLVGDAGLERTQMINENGVPAPQVWRFPARHECATCHTAAAGYALGFNTRQLNRIRLIGALTQNQISALNTAGYLTNSVGSVNTLPAHPALDDNSHSREARVRAYLAVNCSQCHQPGVATGTLWDARATTPTDAAGIINGELRNYGGEPANRFAVPGDVYHSAVLHRLQGNDVARMPPLGSNVVDARAIQLIAEWITEDLPSRRNFSEWQMEHFGSTTAPQAASGADPDADGHSNTFEFLANSSPVISSPRLAIGMVTQSNLIGLSFQQPANRSALVQTSTDLVNWTLWDVPNNRPFFPAQPLMRTLQGPKDTSRRFFRIQLAEP